MKARQFLTEVFQHYNYQVTPSNTNPCFLMARKGEVRLAVGYLLAEREVVVYDLKRFLVATQDGRVYTGRFFITNTRLEYHARQFAREQNIFSWERGKLVQELGKVTLARFERGTFNVEGPGFQAQELEGPGSWSEVQPEADQHSPPSRELDLESPREFFTPAAPEEPKPLEPRSFTEKLREKFLKQAAETEDDVGTEEEEEPGEEEVVEPEAEDLPKVPEFFISLNCSAESLLERFGKDQVLEIALQYIPFLCFDYQCQISEFLIPIPRTQEGQIAVNGLTGECEEWSGDLPASTENSAGGMKVGAFHHPEDMDARIKKAIVSSGRVEGKGGRPKQQVLETTIRHEFVGIYYFPFFNVTLRDRNMIIDGTTGESELEP